YSWPSNGDVKKYTHDIENINWSRPHIKQFIKDALEKTGAEKVYLIGHSMGSRGLASTLIELYAENPEYKKRIDQVILAAPDIDVDIFKRDIAPVLINAGASITLYASSNDKPLASSKLINGHPRAGDTTPDIVVVRGI